MPTRLLREGIIDSAAVNSLSPHAEVFYRRLMSVVDDFGRFDARPAVLRSRLYPLQLESVREASIPRWIAECVKAGLVRLYVVSGRQYILFHKLGAPRAKTSKYPDPPPEIEAMRADENICAQTFADVPDSHSHSHSSSDSIVCVSANPVCNPVCNPDCKSKTRERAHAREGPSSDEFSEAWNALGKPFPRIVRFTDARGKALDARCKDEFWRENWRAALSQLPMTPFLRGEGSTGWIANVEFFLQPDTVQKIIEGKYENGPGRSGKPSIAERQASDLVDWVAEGQAHDS